ncbi:hypothetical protein BWD42_03940 [Sphingobacterium sp. CZ-UAM]|uniref:DUF4294 domain-containing protein n=1 Tax=Sphingobacterium sp. CZ-UAM TaxID=1933868 RepID=UPI0009875093|nr:DUF4294 domain-containing protein [Sphingobacterium sp. CZ-UAM]OOG19108.1 hypothetical protein BWD42_03940 [Sphingobacterium sp. CZ-UAM]
MKTIVGGLLLFLLGTLSGMAQTQSLVLPLYGEGAQETVTDYMTTTLPSGEVLPWFPIPEVVIIRKRVWSSEEARREYLRFRRNVLKVLPYAIYAQKRYDKLDRDLAMTSNKKEQEILVESCENDVKQMFNREIKNMTISQGKILIKLIDRYTGHTGYEMVKEMKGGISAFFYQGVAKIFGHNLKSTYDPKEDFEIENIIREFEKSRPKPVM